MDKYSGLLEWLTLDETTLQLSTIFERKITEADVFRLALEGHLKLSINLVNPTEACRGNVIPIDEANFGEGSSEDTEFSGFYERTVIYENGQREYVIEWEQNITKICETSGISEIYDLTMLGSERDEIEMMYYNLIGLPDHFRLNFLGLILRSKNKQLFRIIDGYNDKFISVVHFPAESILVVRTSELQEFKTRIFEKSNEGSLSNVNSEFPDVPKPPGHLDHDLQWQQRANEIAAELETHLKRKPTRNEVAKKLAPEVGKSHDTVLRRIRAVWKSEPLPKFKK